jgi:hypothetical protein
MKSYPRANPSDGDGVTLSVDLYNRMVEDLERLDRLSVSPPLTMSSAGGGINIGMRPAAAPAAPLVLVVINGTETGGGRYTGSILTGNSTGSTSTNFQLAATPTQSTTDGPVAPTSGGSPVNNALIINVLEPYVSGLHMLYASTVPYYAWGEVMGQTTESTPRTIVYLQSWPCFPVMAKITGTFNSENSGGIYYGRIVQGQFASNSSSGYEAEFKNWAVNFITSVETCWISNAWEQNIATSGVASAGTTHLLPVGTIVPGILTGYPTGAATSPGNQTWAMVYTWYPAQAAALTLSSQATAQTANPTYSSNEQTMLNNLKTDVTNLRSEISTLYNNLKNAGYTL